MSKGTNDTNNVAEQRQRRINKLSSTVLTEEVSDDTNTDDDDDNLQDMEHPEEPIFVLHDRVFVQPCHSPGNIQVRASTNLVVGFVGAVAVGLAVSGCILPVVSVDTSGVIADLILVGEEDARVHTVALSLISVATQLFRDAAFLNNGLTAIGLGSFAIFILLIVMVMPVLCVLGLFVLWFYPLRARDRKKALFLTDRFRMWQYSEIFMISALGVAGTLPQVLDMSRSMVGPYCEAIGAMLVVGVQTGLLEGPEISCYVVKPSLEIGSLLLLAGGFCIALLHGFISSASDQVTQVDSMQRQPELSVGRVGPSSSLTNEEKQTKIKSIGAPTVVFSERYRWFLCPADATVSSP